MSFADRKNLLWLDATGGLTVGVAMLLFSTLLRDLFAMPVALYFSIATANTLYGIFALSLSLLRRRPAFLLKSLVVANATWGLLCLGALPFLLKRVSIFGAAHVLAEGFFVLWLARVEWQLRDLLEWR